LTSEGLTTGPAPEARGAAEDHSSTAKEDRDLQRQWRQWPLAGAAALAGAIPAGHRLPARAEGAAGEISGGGDPRCRVRRDLAWPEELERRRDPLPRC